MKTTFIRFAKSTALAALLFFSCAMSASAKTTDVSKYLVNQLAKQFKGATNVAWKTTSEFTSATFMLNGEKTSVFYNNQNDLIAVSKVIAMEDLPRAARQTINNKYNAYQLVSVIDYTDAEGSERYYIQMENNNKQTILQSDELGHINEFQK